MGLKYTICLVSLSVSLALILVSAAPIMGMGLPLAELMVREAGMRSCALRSRLRIRVGPAKQLWQPVSRFGMSGPRSGVAGCLPSCR